jgi:hypothetical protein
VGIIRLAKRGHQEVSHGGQHEVINWSAPAVQLRVSTGRSPNVGSMRFVMGGHSGAIFIWNTETSTNGFRDIIYGCTL